MKIFILADCMEHGGAETHIYELSRLLSLEGHSVSVFSYGGKTAQALSAFRVRQIHYGQHPLFTLAKFIREEKPNVVHAHTRKSAFLCHILLSYMSFPFVFTAHAHFSEEPFRRALSFFPKRTIAVSHDIAHHLIKGFGVSQKNITVIGNGINVNHFLPKREDSPQNHILTISRLDADCSLTASLLCQLAPKLAQDFEDLGITIVGGGSELPKIRALAQKANHICQKNIVSVIGGKQNVLPYLQEASLFVGVSRAALEAMSCGIPVILSGDEGYLGLAVGNKINMAETGNFCARGYPKPSIKCLYRDIFAAISDSTLAKRAAYEGRKQVMRYHTAEQMTEQTLAVYRAAIRDCRLTQTSDILLCGYYGYDNLGDELTLHAISSALRNAKNENYAKIQPLRLSVLAPKRIAYADLKSVDRLNPIAVLSAIRHTGLFVLGGGSLLQNKTSTRSLLYYLCLLEAAHFLGVPTMLYASGIGPISRAFPYFLCQSVLRRTDLITVRDTDSLALLKRMGIKSNLFLSADPVLFCKMPKAKRCGYLLAFVREEETSRFFHKLKEANKPIHFAVMDKKSDPAATLKLARKLRKHGKNVTVSLTPSAKELAALISGADLVLSARLHALILAFCSGVPFLALSDDPKLSAFSRMAYDGISKSATHADITRHFPQKRQDMISLAFPDAKRALDLSFKL